MKTYFLANINANQAIWDKLAKQNPEQADYCRKRRATEEKKPGDLITHHIGAPGAGTITYKVTEVKPNGDLYGVMVENNSRMLTVADVV